MDESWINKEFKKNSFKDKRLEKRFLKVANSFCDLPSASIAQQAEDWAEAKGAYRFFKNDNVCTDDFFSSHQDKTAERASKYPFVLGIQDTTDIAKLKKKFKVFKKVRHIKLKLFYLGLQNIKIV